MLDEILNKEELTKEDLIFLMKLKDKNDIDKLFSKALEVKLQYIGNKVYYRGLIESSNICIKNCNYCGIRKDNLKVDRFSMTKDEIISLSHEIYNHNFGSLAIQSGERCDENFISLIEESLLEIKSFSNSSLGITLSLGEQSFETYKRWKIAGAHRYLLRIETTNKKLFNLIHPNDDNHLFESRLKSLDYLKKLNYQVGTGVMIGLPFQTPEDLVNDIIFFKEKDIDMIGMGPFIPHKDTPLWEVSEGNIMSPEERFELGLKMIAITRIYLKDVNIASTTALHTLNPEGREKGILAGANIIMPNATTKDIKPKYQLYEGKPSLNDNAFSGLEILEENLRKINHEIIYGEQGNSLHYKKRNKTK